MGSLRVITGPRKAVESPVQFVRKTAWPIEKGSAETSRRGVQKNRNGYAGEKSVNRPKGPEPKYSKRFKYFGPDPGNLR